jgi:23S rRNA pseudouridine1911/1915/1917 synthase
LRYTTAVTRLRARDENPDRPPEVPEGSVVTVFRVPPESAGMRLDVFLQSQLKRTSRTRTQFIVRNSAFGERGNRLRSNDRVQAEQRVMLWRPPWDEQAPDGELTVIYEDEFVFAIDKPAGVPVHPTARYHKSTVIKRLEAARPDERVSLGHRLDRETSGVLVCSRSPAMDRALKKAFMRRDAVEKRYLAITWGVPEERTFRVELPLELDKGSRTNVKMRVAAPGEGLAAATRFEVLEVRTKGDRTYALLACDLETGRQHQIRAHLAAIGTPIVGDKLYAFDEGFFTRDVDGEATDEDRAALEIPRHALHAARLALDHPATGERLVIEAPLPADLVAFWESLDPP